MYLIVVDSELIFHICIGYPIALLTYGGAVVLFCAMGKASIFSARM